MYPNPVLYQQYNNAYPQIHYQQPPCAVNGYGWHGNGYGFQIDPSKWQQAPTVYPPSDGSGEDVIDAIEEPQIEAQKIKKVEAYFGESGSGLHSRDGPQDFYEIRDSHAANGTLFEDDQFPATDSSLMYSRRPDRHYEWLRPGEICEDPKLFVEGYSRFDIIQGELGDCWLLAATANLTLSRKLFFQVVPDDQSFDENYAGIFHFRFWQYGKWIDVVVDDRLPTYRGELIYMHSNEQNEFWSALLEKAYAKLHGSYESLKGGTTCEAMEDFTGGVTEMYELNAAPPDLFKIINKAHERSSLMACSIEPDPGVLEAETSEGLIRGHAYSITRVRYVDIRTPNTSGKIPLLRLRNPWGNDAEWNGAWSDKSPEWRFISDDEKGELGLNFDNDGEFWMSYKDFQSHFDRIEICNLNPDSLSEEENAGHKKWEVSFYEGEWVHGVTAGGCRNYLDTFANNPQYRITLTEVDDDDEDKCTLIVALMQKNRRGKRHMGLDVLTVGFAIYYLPDPNNVPKPLDRRFFKYNASVARSPSFINLREVSCRFKLPPGTYCIVPTTFEPNEEGEFLLRVFSEHKNNMEENDEDIRLGVKPQSWNHQPGDDSEAKTNEIIQMFIQVAGESEEINWQQLKDILNHGMLEDIPLMRKKMNGVDASQSETPAQTREEENILTLLLNLVCGAVCKDTAFAEFIPNATEEPLIMKQPSSDVNNGFSQSVCRSMIAMLDRNCSGKLALDEFKILWKDIQEWKIVFKAYDKDNSDNLSGFELREALNSAGYHLNNHTLGILMHRYGTLDGYLHFEDFLMCAVKLHTMMKIFKEKDQDETNTATFTLTEWVETTLYS